MNLTAEPGPCPGSAGTLPVRSRPTDDAPVYSVVFWTAYAANVAVVTANALTFRFAELVGYLGGSEQTAGTIVGIATAAALLSRLYLGQAIDRYGVRRLWIVSAILFTTGGALLTASDSLSPLLYTARALFAIGLAGIFTCSTVHIQSLVPPHRRTEVIGSLGSSGFVGMIVGALLGDAVFHSFEGRTQFVALFGTSTLLGAAYVVIVLLLTRNERHERPAVTPAVHQLALRFWPGNVMLVAFAMGLMVAVTTVFLTRFATHRELSGLGSFFLAYAGSAFTFRLISRGWSRTVGRHRMILMGLAGHAVAMFLLPFVTNEWFFMVPAACGGFGHALLFPAVVSLGSEAFPREYRGTGTTIVMGFFDVGTFVSAPILGGIIDAFDGTGFTPMFLFAAAVAVTIAAIYQLTSARSPDSDLLSFQPAQPHPVAAGSRANGTWAGRFSPIEPFAPRSFATEGTVYEISARGEIDTELSAPEGTGAGSSAPEENASERSAREESIVRPAPHRVDHARPAAIVPATRCR